MTMSWLTIYGGNRILKNIVYSMLNYVLRVFYSQDVLTCKWFNKWKIGYLWAIKSIPHRIKRCDIKVPYSKAATFFQGRICLLIPRL